MTKNQKGFTLIELLIVIVIIGILAGVLIAIIDPAAQQNRAKDAGVQASINKAALATQGFVSAYGDTPEDDEFLGSLSGNASDVNGDCADGDYECTFSIVGNELRTASNPVGACDPATGWTWSSAVGYDDCMYHYEGNLGPNTPATDFRICAISHGVVDGTFCFDSQNGYMEQCDGDGATNCSRIGNN